MTLTIHAFSDKRSQFVAEMARRLLSECGFRDELKLDTLDRGSGKRSSFSILRDVVASGDRDAALCTIADLPFDLPGGLRVLHSPGRLARSDCLLSKGSYTRLQSGAMICCSGKLRRAQLLRARGDLDVSDIGGSAEEQIRAVEDGRFSAASFAACDAEALGYGGTDSLKLHELPLAHFVPAAGQGVNVLIFPDGALPEDVVKRADNIQSRNEASMEREALKILVSRFKAPLGISCASFGSGFTLRIQLLSEDGTYEKLFSRSIRWNADLSALLSVFIDGVATSLLGR